MSVFDTYDVSFVSTYSCVAKSVGMSDFSASSPSLIQLSGPGMYGLVQTFPSDVWNVFAFSAASRDGHSSTDLSPQSEPRIYQNVLSTTSTTLHVSSTLPSLSVHGPYVPGAEESVLTSPFP